MMQFLIAAPRSGSGKTTMTCAVLAALKKRGADPCAFKSGPDYIDPMFHRSALQVDSHNLDLFLSDRPAVQALYARCAAGHGAAVAALTARGFSAQVTQIAVSRTKPAGKLHLLMANNPTFLITGERP